MDNPAYKFFEPGSDIEIWYMKPEWFRQGITGQAFPDPANLEATHVKVASIRDQDQDRGLIFHNMQGEVWSPKGEARELIESLGLGHTSMSVGDVLRYADGTIFVALNVGWLADQTQRQK